eukprot:COSAG01_NODE_2417_length_7736_cov_7.862511_9_plen_83_part_00
MVFGQAASPWLLLAGAPDYSVGVRAFAAGAGFLYSAPPGWPSAGTASSTGSDGTAAAAAAAVRACADRHHHRHHRIRIDYQD